MNNLMIFQERQVLGKDFKIYGTKENPLFLAKDVANWIEHSRASEMLNKQNIKIGEKRLWNKLREWGLIQKGSTKPMQRALEQGLFEKAEFVIQRSYGVETKFTTRVTGKGQVYIIERLLKESA